MKKYDIPTRDFIRVIQKISHNTALLHAFLNDILSPAEYEDIIKRWQIIKELSTGKPQRDIAKKLHVSIAKITRGSRELSNPKGGFQKALKQL